MSKIKYLCARLSGYSPLLLVALLQGCAFGGSLLKEANSLSEVGSNEVLVVGKIEIVPKLGKNEQHIEPGGVDVMGWVDMHKDRAMLQLNDSKEIKESYQVFVNPKLGETFYFKIPKSSPYIVEGSVLIEQRFEPVGWSMVGGQMHQQVERTTNKIKFPGKFKLDIRPNDKAIYIGKIRFYRDEFNSVTKVRLYNEYNATLKE